MTAVYSVRQGTATTSGPPLGLGSRSGNIFVSSSSNTKTSNVNYATALQNLPQKCALLRKYHSYQRTALPSDVFKLFSEVAELAVAVSTQGPEQYEEYYEIVHSVFGDVAPIVPGSVAAFFVGCSLSTSKSGSSVGCQDGCAGNLPTPGYTIDDFCDSHVGLHSGTSLDLSYSPTEQVDSILIYHNSLNPSLTREEVSRLKKMGITTALLIYTGGPVRHTSKPVSINSLLSKQTSSSNKKRIANSIVHHKEKKEEDYGWGWIIAAVILLLIIIVIVYLVLCCCGTEEYDSSVNSNGGYRKP